MNCFELLQHEGVAVVPGPARSAEEGRAWLTSLVEGWGSLHGHDAAGRLVWDVRVEPGGQARSQRMDEFSLHTDASFEDPPPRYVGLLVIRRDALGGGQSQWVSCAEVLGRVSARCRADLRKLRWLRVPAEFCKGEERVRGPLLCGQDLMRYRREVLDSDIPEFSAALQGERTSLDLAEGTLLLLDNWRFFHGRTAILDNSRHLLRVRFFGPEVPVIFGDVGQWRRGLSLFEAGEFWEAHEAWEELWQISHKLSCAGLVLRGLIQAAAACLKSRRGEERGVRILAARAARTLRSASCDRWNGVDLSRLCPQLDELRVGQRLWL
ncbi:MAG: DUF309 domain-containing protein [Candidatus Eremiobacteraeota bacterium]|nr:DUF309 domain-containing protein [Candidatus Eremiobacteraeota bacterium]MCW5871968.1 DUF309 domain-containing protein [Candidatus Eremiobacteraeota bacterium]